MELSKTLFEHSFEHSLEEIEDYVEKNFTIDAQGKIIRKNPGPDVIIIDHLSLLK